MRTKILGKHRKDCYALASVKSGDWDTPWAFLETTEYRDRAGRRQSKRFVGNRWWRVRCNDPDCSAEIAVEEDSILVLLPDTP